MSIEGENLKPSDRRQAHSEERRVNKIPSSQLAFVPKKRSPLRHMNNKLIIVVILLVITNQSYAYVDPGSGYLLWQFVLAGVVGSAYFLKNWIKRFFFRRSQEISQAPQPNNIKK